MFTAGLLPLLFFQLLLAGNGLAQQPPPGIETLAATNISTNYAQLQGIVAPRCASGTGWLFEYGFTTNFGNTTPIIWFPATTNDVPVFAAVSNLAPGTGYAFRIKAFACGVTNFYADIRGFATLPGAPTVSVAASPSNITNTPTTATLAYYLTTGDLDTTVTLQYGQTTSYGSTATTNVTATTPRLLLTELIGGLSPGTTYHVRVVATNSAGSAISGDNTFNTTGFGAPVVATLAASAPLGTNATLNGTINPNGLATTAYFQYGLTTNYGSFSATNILAATYTTQSVSNLISGLSPATTYHFQLMGFNGAGTNAGADMLFTTASPQPVAFSLQGPIKLPGGAFQLNFSNLSGLGFTLLGSTNLALPLTNWTVLGPAVESPAGSGNYQFTDAQATNYPHRFYRVRSP